MIHLEYLGLIVLAITAGLSVFLLAEWWGRRRDRKYSVPPDRTPALDCARWRGVPSVHLSAEAHDQIRRQDARAMSLLRALHRATEADWELWAQELRRGADR